MDKCDQAKKTRLTQDNQVEVPEKLKHGRDEAIPPPRSMSLDFNTIGMEEGDESESFEPIPEWLIEVAEDLDSCMAQRHFEEAYNLLEKAKCYLREAQSTPELNEITGKVNDRARSLVDGLTRELELSAEAKSLQGGGLRSARRAVRILIQLDRSAQACQLYLQLCSAALKARLKKVKREGATIPYVNQLSAIAFSNIVDIAREFLKLFPEATNCTSGKSAFLILGIFIFVYSRIKFVYNHCVRSARRLVQPRSQTSNFASDKTTIYSSSHDEHAGGMYRHR